MFRALSAHRQGRHLSVLYKKLHNNTWSVVCVDLLAIIRVVICDTGS